MRLFDKDNRVINMFLKLLGFDYLSMGNHGEIWRHHSKNIITNNRRKSNVLRWIYNSKDSLIILVKENFLKN